MICPNCGKEIPDESLFCGECGADIKSVSQEPVAEQVVAEPTVAAKTEPVKNEPNGSNTMSLLSLIFGIIGMVLIFVNTAISIALSVAAIILGLIGRKVGARSMGTAGLVLGIISTVISAVIFIGEVVIGIAAITALYA